MSKNRINSPNFLPVPTRGMDLRIPMTSMPPEYSPFMINYMVNNGKLRKRNPHVFWGYGSTTETAVPIVIPRQSDADIIVVGEVDTYSFAHSAVTTPAEIHPPLHDYIYFNNILLICGYGVVYSLNESSLAYTAGLTFTPTGGAGDRQPITHYRQRVYVGSGTNLYYGGVGAYGAAAMTAFDISAYLDSGRIFGLSTFNYSGNDIKDQVLVIVGAHGEVLVYSGTYPGATDWYLVNKFDLGCGFLDNDNPYELVTVSGDLLINVKFSHQVFSVAKLLSGEKGSAAEFGLFEGVEALWTEALINTASAPSSVGIKSLTYWPQQSALIMHVYLWFVEKHPFLDVWRNELDGFEDTNDSYSFLIYGDLNAGTTTLHTYPAISGSTSDLGTGQLRSGLLGPIAPARVTVSAAVRAAAIKLFSREYFTGTNTKDWDGATNGSATFPAHCVFAPMPQTSDIEAIKNAILFSNIHSSHSVSYAISQGLNYGPPTLTTFTSSSSTVTPRTDLLGAVAVGSGLLFHLREAGSYQSPFECYGVRLIEERGGLY